jgi:hypothetical protein
MVPESGSLLPERLGIGRPLYRSFVSEQVLGVPGAVDIGVITRNGRPFTEMAIDPGPGHYFDLENGALILNGQENFDV